MLKQMEVMGAPEKDSIVALVRNKRANNGVEEVMHRLFPYRGLNVVTWKRTLEGINEKRTLHWSVIRMQCFRENRRYNVDLLL